MSLQANCLSLLHSSMLSEVDAKSELSVNLHCRLRTWQAQILNANHCVLLSEHPSDVQMVHG